ncbi:sulfatase/phosphatase domain-containing protein [Luteolibacter algae]|uniref:Sulfatase/phosphatase domain-containing protein n=1 Tax=Luteolibacter algae TaxID=454151 RepID=A0ABW5D4R3_9BACT
MSRSMLRTCLCRLNPPGYNLPLNGTKGTCLEGGTRVAACVRWPAAWPGGRKIENTIGYIDILPTVLDSAGIDPKAGEVPGKPLDGMSLNGLLRGDDEGFKERDWYSYYGQGTEEASLYSFPWKLIVTGAELRKGFTTKHEVRLYRMPEDPLEKDNVASDHLEIVQTMAGKLVTWCDLQQEMLSGEEIKAEAKGFKPPKNWQIQPPTKNGD